MTVITPLEYTFLVNELNSLYCIQCGMYQNFEVLEPGEDIKNFKFFWVSPNPLGVLNQKNLLSTLIYQFEYFGTP